MEELTGAEEMRKQVREAGYAFKNALLRQRIAEHKLAEVNELVIVQQIRIRELEEEVRILRPPLSLKLCWSGPTYSHPPHEWKEDKPGGETFLCRGASTDRT